MKTIIFACGLSAALVLMGAGRGEDFRKRPIRPLLPSAPAAQTPGPGRAERVERAEHVDRAERTERAIRGQSAPEAATRVDAGARRVRSAPSAIGARELTRIERSETEPNRYYWHTESNTTYTHYYTGQDHWYGFYAGPTFYWTQYYGAYWWYYDPSGMRWVYWSNGFWWWPGPGGAYYVYLDDRYYPYEESRVIVTTRPAYSAADATTTSPDNRRMAQILGADAQAFLYDKTVSPPKFMKFLGQGVSKVRFTEAGEPARILVEHKNGTFALFDADGVPQKAAAKKGEPASVPPPKPASIPPAPTSAPGR